jgi:molecular chaperone GrpE (heat shock protein)
MGRLRLPKLRILEPLEFRIDEQPVEITGPVSDLEDKAGPQDFLTEIGELLGEGEQLRVQVKLLEREKGGEKEMEKLMRRMLPVLDGFERILEAARDWPEDSEIANWLKSVEGTYVRLKNTLEAAGLVSFEAVGKPVDLTVHDVVEMRHSPDHEPETVIAVRQKGYAFLGRLIRDAKVVVAK